MILGISGYARVGKDTLASMVPFSRIAFADALKADLMPIFERLGLSLLTHKEVCRPMLVEYGRLARAVFPDYWITRLAQNRPSGDIVIPDVRYQNEAEWIKACDCPLIWIDRDGYGPANEEEKKFTAPLRDMADLIIRNKEGDPEWMGKCVTNWLASTGNLPKKE